MTKFGSKQNSASVNSASVNSASVNSVRKTVALIAGLIFLSTVSLVVAAPIKVLKRNATTGQTDVAAQTDEIKFGQMSSFAASASTIPMTLQGAPSQSASMLVIQDSVPTVRAAFSASGAVVLTPAAATVGMSVVGPSDGTVGFSMTSPTGSSNQIRFVDTAGAGILSTFKGGVGQPVVIQAGGYVVTAPADTAGQAMTLSSGPSSGTGAAAPVSISAGPTSAVSGTTLNTASPIFDFTNYLDRGGLINPSKNSGQFAIGQGSHILPSGATEFFCIGNTCQSSGTTTAKGFCLGSACNETGTAVTGHCIGSSCSNSSSGFCYGSSCTNSGAGICIGASCANTGGTSAMCIGTSCTSGNNLNSMCVGPSCQTSAASTACVGASCNISAASGTCIGNSCAVTASSGLCIGASCSAAGGAGIQNGASATPAAGEVYIGGSGTGGVSVTNTYFGKGATNVTPGTTTIQSTGGVGTDIAGGSFQIAGSKGTGAGSPGPISFLVANALASSSTLQTPAVRVVMTSSAAIFGNGTSQSTPAIYPIQGTNGNGSNRGGGALELRAGIGTGLQNGGTAFAAGAPIIFQSSPPGSTGSTLNTPQTFLSLESAGSGGQVSATPMPVVIQGVGGLGTNIAGASVSIAAGRATGNATPGSIFLQTSQPSGSSSSSLRAILTKWTLDGNGQVLLKSHINFTGSEDVTLTGAVQTANSAQTVLTGLTFTMPLASVCTFLAKVTAREDVAGTDDDAFFIKVKARRIAGGAVLSTIQSVTTADPTAGAATWAATFTVSGNIVRVSVTGAVGVVVDWAGTLEYQCILTST